MRPVRVVSPVSRLLFAAWLLGASAAHAAPAVPLYASQGRCAGHARIALSVPQGWCAGLVADARDGLLMPRRLLEVSPGLFWIVDMGSWEPRRGRLLAFRPGGRPGDPGRLTVLAKGLDRPHGLARGPDNKVYLAEAGRIWRTPVGETLQSEDVITGLPDQGAHPLKEIAFGSGGQLFINVGSISDACRNDRQQQPLPCPERTGPEPRAAVYLAQLGGPGWTLQSLKPFASGLRNSLGLALLPAPGGRQQLWQAENSVDYADATAPAEELNLLQAGSDHGWPYCVSDARGKGRVARGYEGRAACATPALAPAMAWPAHVAPLQLLAVPPAASAKSETPWSGRLLAVWHGYRAQGQRVVAWRVGADGRPTGPREDLVSGWSAKPGVRPLGSPAGATLDAQGRLWIVEDRNRALIVIAPDRPR
jgi:glucose/arabinose dehydrogenase